MTDTFRGQVALDVADDLFLGCRATTRAFVWAECRRIRLRSNGDQGAAEPLRDAPLACRGLGLTRNVPSTATNLCG